MSFIVEYKTKTKTNKTNKTHAQTKNQTKKPKKNQQKNQKKNPLNIILKVQVYTFHFYTIKFSNTLLLYAKQFSVSLEAFL